MADEELSEEEVTEGHEEDHIVPADLLELYEVLEFTGKITPNFPKGAELRAASILTATQPPGTIIGRSAWGALAPRSVTALRSPSGNTGHYEGPEMGVYDHPSCATKVRGIQAFHMNSRGWSDIAYNSIICRHGVIFMGRGWGVRSAANGTNEGNAAHYAHCVMIGVNDEFTPEAKIGLAVAFSQARQHGGAGTEQKVHSDWKATACPGDPVRNFIRAGLPIAPPPIVPQEDDIMLHSEIVTVPTAETLPDGRRRQLATLQRVFPVGKVAAVQVQCQDGGVPSNVVVQKTSYAGVLVLSFKSLGGGDAPTGNVWIDVTYVN